MSGIGQAGGAINVGDLGAQAVSQRVASPQLTMTALNALTARERVNGMQCRVLADDSLWIWSDASALTGDNILVATPADAPAAGRWLRAPGDTVLVLPFTFATADAAALLTLQNGSVVRPWDFFWTVSTGFTGGTASAIGASSNNAAWSTKGDFLGGSGGDVAATLVAPSPVYVPIYGSQGGKWDTIAHQRNALVPGNIVRFDRVTSAFTQGVGAVNIICTIVQNAGA